MNPEADSSERDPVLESAWRAHSREVPPPELDRAILAAAHRAVGSGPQDALKSAASATRPQRWWMPLAAAATIGVIAIGILQEMPQEPSLVAPQERVASVARRGVEEPMPAPAAGKTVDDAAQTRDEASVGARSATEDFRQKKKQEAKPVAKPAAPLRAPAPSSAPPTTTIAGQKELDTLEPSARASEPQPFPAATESRKNAFADTKRDDPKSDIANSAANVVAQAPQAATQTAPAVMAEERTASRKDADRERQQVGRAMDKATASAQSGRPAQAAGGAVSAFAPAPASPATSPSDGSLARNEVQAAPAASPPRMLAKKVATPEEMRAQARDPDAWIVRIRKLRDEGNTAEALRELSEFRNLVPDADHRLPADLLAWANTFK